MSCCASCCNFAFCGCNKLLSKQDRARLPGEAGGADAVVPVLQEIVSVTSSNHHKVTAHRKNRYRGGCVVSFTMIPGCRRNLRMPRRC